MVKWVCLAAIFLLATAATVFAEEDVSSAELVQFAVSKMGDTNQEAQISDFNIADSRQIGYSWDGTVTQTVSYDNIENGSILQWGESGDMPREERSLLLDRIGDSGFTWQWEKGDVDQTINIKNSENIYLKQIVGGLKKILFPDPNAPAPEMESNWWFCGKAVNGTGGLPLCAEKFAKKIVNGKGTAREIYMLEVLQGDYDIYPPDNLNLHVVLTKWNITKKDDNMVVKFRVHNFGKKQYNATLFLGMTPRINTISLDKNYETVQVKGNVAELNVEDEIKIPESKTVQLGNFTIPRTKGEEKEIEVPLKGLDIKKIQLKIVSE